MRTYSFVLSFLLMQSCIYCHVINSNPDSYEIIDVAKLQGDAANKDYWQEAHMLVPEQVEQNSWLKYLSEEFRKALKEDGTESQMQADMYQQQLRNAQYEEPKKDTTTVVYRETMTDRDAMPDWERTKVKKSARMDMMKTKTQYPQYVNFISKQVDVRSPEAVFVTFPEHTQILDEFGRVVGTAPPYVQLPQRYTEEPYSKLPQQNEKKEHKQTEHKKPKGKLENHETSEENEKVEKRSSSEEKPMIERKMKNKHDKKADKHKKQSMSKQKEEMRNKSYEHNTSQQDKRQDTKSEEEEMTPNTYTQNQARYKTPLHSAQDLLLAKLNGPFAFGKNVL